MVRVKVTRSDAKRSGGTQPKRRKRASGKAGGKALRTWGANFFDKRERRRYRRALEAAGLTVFEHGHELSGPASETREAFYILGREGDALSWLALSQIKKGEANEREKARG